MRPPAIPAIRRRDAARRSEQKIVAERLARVRDEDHVVVGCAWITAASAVDLLMAGVRAPRAGIELMNAPRRSWRRTAPHADRREIFLVARRHHG